MLTSLLQFQSQNWEKWLSWIGFVWKDRLSTIIPINSVDKAVNRLVDKL